MEKRLYSSLNSTSQSPRHRHRLERVRADGDKLTKPDLNFTHKISELKETEQQLQDKSK